MNDLLEWLNLQSASSTYYDLILVIVLSLLTLGIFHLYLIPLIALFTKSNPHKAAGSMDYLILVPAHNEQIAIAATLESLLQLENSGKRDIVVIADNCTDNTGEVAQSFGVTVLARHDDERRGKGYALRYAFDNVDIDQYDAVVIVDADTLADTNMLIAMSEAFAPGVSAVQVSNQFLVTEHSALARLQQMANQVENILFYDARSRLNLSILLRGTGMAIRSDVLQSVPWESHSVTEDVEYSVNLLLQGHKISFMRRAAVYSAATSTYGQSFAQRQRWASGTFNLITEWMLVLILHGLRNRKVKLLELAFSLLLLSRPTLIMLGMVLSGLSLAASGGIYRELLGWSLGVTATLVLYLMIGILFVQEKKEAMIALVQIPFWGIWVLGVQVLAFVRRRKLGWTRTRRTEE